MAQAQVVITAVDKTQAAINSAVRSMKSIERTAKVTSKAINAAFGLFTGGLLISAFGKIIDAAKKTEEGAKSVENLKKTLADPALVSAAQSISKTLIDGFTVAAGGVAAFSKLVKNELLRLGVVEAKNAEDAISVLQNKIDAIRKRYQFSVKGETIISPISKEDLAAIAELERRIALLGDSGQRGRGPGARRGPMQVDELKQMENTWKAAVDLRQSEAKWADETLKASQKLREQESKNLNQIKKELEDLLDISTSITEFENSFADSIDSSFIDLQDRIAEEFSPDAEWARNLSDAIDESLPDNTDLYAAFARDIGSAMTNALSQFLFNPFENGLKGMLKGFLDVVRQIVAQMAAVEILTAIFAPFAGTSGLGGRIYNSLTKKEMGGPVSGGRPYIVGERGPELFVPNSSGGIVPNNRLGMGGGFTLAPVYNIDARGATADLSQALPGILQENNRRIFDELDRRYGIGR